MCPAETSVIRIAKLQVDCAAPAAINGPVLFVAGFGSVSTIPWLLFSFFHSEALMAMAFPLFALAACVSDPLAHYQKGSLLLLEMCHAEAWCSVDCSSSLAVLLTCF